MSILVTGSAGHLGEALMRLLAERDLQAVGADILPSPFTTHVGSIADPAFVKTCMEGVDTVLHAATLHKPHVATHARQAFVDTNITGTLNLLEAAVAGRVGAFVFTSTTSTFGDALIPPPGAPAAWITEDCVPLPKNIYGVTKTAAEDLCRLFHRNHGLACIVLRASRFFPEEDDNPDVRRRFADANIKANEYLYRRVDIADAAEAHLLAAERAEDIGFGRYIISATPPFTPGDMAALRTDAPGVLRRYFPEYEDIYHRLGWRMNPGIDRVYVSEAARRALGWRPRHDFAYILSRLAAGQDFASPMARAVGAKGYHARAFSGMPYPVD